MIDDELKELERSLLNSDKAFGLLTVVDYPSFNLDLKLEGEALVPTEPEDKVFDLRLYYLTTTAVVKNKRSASGTWLASGYDMEIGAVEEMCKTGEKNENFEITMNDFAKVLGVFKKCKRELICDFQNEFASFSLDKYIERIKSLNVNAN